MTALTAEAIHDIIPAGNIPDERSALAGLFLLCLRGKSVRTENGRYRIGKGQKEGKP
jgi:hypothetical protein